MNRINSISDRLAAYTVILALMFPDAVALARVIELQPWSHQSAAEQISHISTEKVSPNHQEFSINESEANRILKNEIQIPAQEQLVFIGRSEMDPVASPNNDFVTFFVSEEQLVYYVSLQTSWTFN